MMNPDFIWAAFDEDISAQTREVYAQCEPEGFVRKPTKYIRADLVGPEITILSRELEDQRDELQVKLTKAVEALKYTDDGANHGVMTPTYSETGLRYILRNIRDHARLALEELKGET